MAETTTSWTREDLQNMDRAHRLKLVNCLSGFKSANLVGTRSTAGVDNLAVFSSCVHLGSNPALLGLIFRPDTVPRHTLNNIKDTGVYTINAIGTGFFEAAHRTSLKYEASVSEFEEVGLTPVNHPELAAPYVQESPLRIGMRFMEQIPIPANGTSLVVGAVEQVFVDDSAALHEDNGLNLEALSIVAIGGVDQYYSAAFLKQMPYEKVGETVRQ